MLYSIWDADNSFVDLDLTRSNDMRQRSTKAQVRLCLVETLGA
jgi:hypothetical protein